MEACFDGKCSMNDLKVMCVVKRWEHLTPSGGYEVLARAVGAEIVRRRTDRSLTRRIAGRLWREFSHPKPYLLDYRYEDWLTETYVLGRRWWHPPDIVHVLNGDEQLDLLLRKRQLLSCPLVATFHLPPQRVRERFERVQKHLLSGIDVAVVVATNQLKAFASWLGPDRVVYVPHGINTVQFCPREPIRRNGSLRLLTVGHHMRNWKAIDEIIAKSREHKLDVQFDIVALEHGLSDSAHRANVHFYKGISEERLIQFYCEADALLLPVHDATATNAALEALACGTPVITNLVGGMPDYVDEACGWLFEKDEVDGIVRLISDICREREIGWSRRSAARNKALGFSWERVAGKMREIYAAAVTHRISELVTAEWQ